jgi:hypothetical protein
MWRSRQERSGRGERRGAPRRRRWVEKSLWILPLLAVSVGGGGGSLLTPSDRSFLAAIEPRFRALGRDAAWKRVTAIPLQFSVHHPQGMVRIGENFYLSAVEIKRPTVRYSSPREGMDRDPGEGVGHLFRFDQSGRQLADLLLGEGSLYHPSGIDYDGRWLWVAVAEYRPRSRSILYRVDPESLAVTEVLRIEDHLGVLLHDRWEGVLHGASWGSRHLYRWKLEEKERGRPTLRPLPVRLNPSFYIDYQDCHAIDRQRMLCGGVSSYPLPGKPGGVFRLGGLELVDLARGGPIHQIPVEERTPSGLPMTQNPFWIEPYENHLRGWFLPEDGIATLYGYEIAPTTVRDR